MTVRAAVDPPRVVPAPDLAGEARAAVRLGLWVSAARCVLVYLIAPALAGIGPLIGRFGLILQILGTITSLHGAHTLWRTGHRARYGYAVLATTVTLTTCAEAYLTLR